MSFLLIMAKKKEEEENDDADNTDTDAPPRHREKRKMSFYGVYDDEHYGSMVAQTWDEALAQQMAVRRMCGRTVRIKKFQERADAERYSHTGSAAAEEDTKNDDDVVYAYSDGSAAGGFGGCGVTFVGGDRRYADIAEPLPCPPRATNNRAELYAIALAVRAVTPPFPTRLVVRSDNDYAVNALTTWRPVWTASNFNGDTLANRELIESIWRTLDEAPFTVVIEWVSGHSGVAGNERADALAKEGREKASRQAAANNRTNDDVDTTRTAGAEIRNGTQPRKRAK